MKSIVKRCPADGLEHDFDACACSVCFGVLRFWCCQCQMWLQRAGCAICGETNGLALPPEGDQVNEWIIASVHEIRTIIYGYFDDVGTAPILGSYLSSLRGSSSGHNLTTLALSSDCLRTAVDALNADGQIADDEVCRIHPFFNAVATFFAEYRSNYRQFVSFHPARTSEFVRFYQSDNGRFGYGDMLTSWSGLEICVNLASTCNDTRGFDLYERLITNLASQLVSLGGTTASERTFMNALKHRLSVARART